MVIKLNFKPFAFEHFSDFKHFFMLMVFIFSTSVYANNSCIEIWSSQNKQPSSEKTSRNFSSKVIIEFLKTLPASIQRFINIYGVNESILELRQLSIHGFKSVFNVFRFDGKIVNPPTSGATEALLLFSDKYLIRPNVYRDKSSYREILDFSDLKNLSEKLPLIVYNEKSNSFNVEYGKIGQAIFTQLKIEKEAVSLYRGASPQEKQYLLSLKNQSFEDRVKSLENYFINKSSKYEYDGMFFTDDIETAKIFNFNSHMKVNIPISLMKELLLKNYIYSGAEIYSGRAYFEFCFYEPKTLATIIDYLE